MRTLVYIVWPCTERNTLDNDGQLLLGVCQHGCMMLYKIVTQACTRAMGTACDDDVTEILKHHRYFENNTLFLRSDVYQAILDFESKNNKRIQGIFANMTDEDRQSKIQKFMSTILEAFILLQDFQDSTENLILDHDDVKGARQSIIQHTCAKFMKNMTG